VLLRAATDHEVNKSLALIERLQKEDHQTPNRALNNFCSAAAEFE